VNVSKIENPKRQTGQANDSMLMHRGTLLGEPLRQDASREAGRGPQVLQSYPPAQDAGGRHAGESSSPAKFDHSIFAFCSQAKS
jgi:hypothetical protein